MPSNDFINRQLNRIISDNSPATLMGLRGLVRFNRVPPFVVYGVIIAIVASWIPLAGAVRARFVTSEKPRVHIFQDMDNQPRYEAQAANPVFANNMAMRPKIPGTVARGQLEEDDFFHRGYRITGTGSGVQPQVEWLDGFPKQIPVTPELMARGKELFARYCYACHGYDGYGNGPVHVRAQANPGANAGWVQPSNLHDDVRRSRPTGHIYNTIINGIRTMGPYGAQIQNPEDRWAVVAYVRALQLSQNAPPEMIPAEQRQQVPVRPATIGGRTYTPAPAEGAAGTQPAGNGDRGSPQ